MMLRFLICRRSRRLLNKNFMGQEMLNKFKAISGVIFILFILVGCKADKGEVTLYTSDIEDALSGKVVEVPLKATFTIMGKDEKNLLGKSTSIAKRYLSKGSKFSRSKSQFGERLVIETKIPLSKNNSSYKKFIKKNGKRAAVVGVFGKKLYFLVSKHGRKALNEELKKINYMISLDKIIKRASYRVVSDSRKKYKVSAYAVWVSGKPYLYYNKILERRDEALLTFKGDDGSVYSQLQHHIIVEAVEKN